MASTVFALSIHADYRCRHSGECCSTDWDVPIEVPFYRTLEQAWDAGRLTMGAHAGRVHPFVVAEDPSDDAAAIFERVAGACVFLDRGSNLCIVHRDLGEVALPSTCRHFPRLALRDGRGTFITLSHYCPTAAGKLFRDDVELAIVAHPPAFPPADYEGLVVGEDDLPPLLNPAMLMDLDGYAAWEAHMVRRCASLNDPPESVLATLRRDAGSLRRWRPGEGTLRDAVARLPREAVGDGPPDTLAGSLACLEDVMTAVPEDLRPARDEHGLDEAFTAFVRPAWREFHAPLNRFLAGKAFASWTAYQGRGVISVVRGLEAALALVRIEAARECRDRAVVLDADRLLQAFRGADFWLNHLAVGDELAAAWSRIEE